MSNFNPTYAQQQASYINQVQADNKFNYLQARVTHIVQGPVYVGTNVPDPYYKDPSDLGVITFQLISGLQDRTLDSGGNLVARPMYSALKQYPIEGEIVLLFPGPSRDLNEDRGRRDIFYTMPYNIWGLANHNAFPDLGDYGAYIGAINRTYQDSANTNQPVNTSSTGSLNMPLGPNFVEKSNIKTLKQFTGDLTIEGRWGNSIRFSSTNPVPADQNPWSKNSAPGNPIIIIRNGQGMSENNITAIPTVENINKDPSSIYLTQGQQIVVDDINNNFSLASLDVVLARTYTVSIPIQQQLTSTDNISAAQQDSYISTVSQQPPSGPKVTNDNSTAATTPPSQATTVVGEIVDLQAISGTYVVSLRAVDSTGTVLSSVSETASTVQAAYNAAVTAIKNKNQNTTLVIPSINSLLR